MTEGESLCLSILLIDEYGLIHFVPGSFSRHEGCSRLEVCVVDKRYVHE